jgi:hypothetical protein
MINRRILRILHANKCRATLICDQLVLDEVKEWAWCTHSGSRRRTAVCRCRTPVEHVGGATAGTRCSMSFVDGEVLGAVVRIRVKLRWWWWWWWLRVLSPPPLFTCVSAEQEARRGRSSSGTTVTPPGPRSSPAEAWDAEQRTHIGFCDKEAGRANPRALAPNWMSEFRCPPLCSRVGLLQDGLWPKIRLPVTQT